MATETSSGARRGAATDQAVSEAELVEKRDVGVGAPCCGYEAGQTEATVLAADTASVADTQVAQQTHRIQGETPHNPTTTLALGEHAALAAPAVDVETVARQAVQCVVDRVLSRPEVFARCFVRDLVRKCARRTAWQQQQERLKTEKNVSSAIKVWDSITIRHRDPHFEPRSRFAPSIYRGPGGLDCKWLPTCV